MVKPVIDVTQPISHYTGNADSLTQYLKDIRKYDVLTPQEEHELCVRVKNGDDKAREKLINSHLRFVYAIAKRYSNSKNIMDLIQIGNVGLMQAIEKFDCDRVNEDGTPLRFLSYAVWYIRREISFSLLNEGLIRKTNNVKTTLKVNQVKNRFFLENGRVPTADEIADIIKEEYGIEVKDPSYLYDVDTRYLENTIGDEPDGRTFSNTSAFNEKSATYNEVNKIIDAEQNEYTLEKLLPCLDERERFIITKFNGIKTERPWTMEEIAEELHISKERVRQLKQSALKKLKKYSQQVKIDS